MSDSNPGDGARREEPDAYGQAALLLSESILHALVEKKTFSVSEALIVVQTAVEVKTELAAAIGESQTRMRESLALLARVETSLRTDELASKNGQVTPIRDPS